MAVTPEVGEVVEARRQAREVADAVAVAVHEGPHVDLVDDGVAVPLRVGREAGAQPRSAERGARRSLVAIRRLPSPTVATDLPSCARRAAMMPPRGLRAGPASRGHSSDRSSTSE